MNVTFKTLEDWPKEKTPEEDRQKSRFDSSWSATLRLLQGELTKLGAESVVIHADFKEGDIRQDGWPRSNARTPAAPGVVIEWQVGERWSRMAADRFTHWQDNIRAVALSLEALRAVERWGAVEGEQYEGLRLEISAPGPSDANAARKLIDSYGGLGVALKTTHPDHGGDSEEFQKVQEARRVLGL